MVSSKGRTCYASNNAVKLVRTIFVLCLLTAPAFATGGSCPSGAVYLIGGSTTPATLASYGITSCYYVSKSLGSDANTGTTEASPFAHLPGMPSCTSNCASLTPTAGEGFILRGGDTWVAADLGVNWQWSGSSSHPIYVGVDPAWPSSGWTRPIFTCGGAECAGGTWNNYVTVSGPSWLTFDNIEMTGMDWTDGQKHDDYFYVLATNVEIEHMYFHGWVTGSPSYDASAAFADGSNGASAIAGTRFHDNIVDGSDTSKNGFTGETNFEQVYNNYFRYVHVAVFVSSNIVHDNLVEYPVISVTGDHANSYALFSPLSGTNLLVYNNVDRNTSSCSGCVNFYLMQDTGTNPSYATYFFNNVAYNLNPSNVVDIGPSNPSGSYGSFYLLNNTIECGNDSSQTACAAPHAGNTSTVYDINNHWITSAGDTCSGYAGSGETCTETTTLYQTLATAKGQGYNSSETYAFSPASGCTSSTCGTVQKGTNKQASCTAIAAINADAGTACQSSTGYACTYNTSNHTISCPNMTLVTRSTSTAWDIGTYQYNTQNPPPNPPQGLAAVVH
jgi:hypothetical protein